MATRILHRAALLACCFGLTGCMTAEQRVAQQVRAVEELKADRNRNNGSGYLLIDASFYGKGCGEVTIGLARHLIDGHYDEVYHFPASSKFFGLFSAARLNKAEAGDYVVSRVSCKSGKHTDRFNGPHAKFHVLSGEVVNVGRLVLAPKSDGFWSSTGTLVKTVEPIGDENLDKNRESQRELMKLIVNRPMTIVGPVESRTTTRF